mmetsp:Transcript_12285/g.42551  ORF Transcript_12285/g.42551 Transcript_12285/m.42551 type:complete len:206 (-) Transcript_12285:183-800(-)
MASDVARCSPTRLASLCQSRSPDSLAVAPRSSAWMASASAPLGVKKTVLGCGAFRRRLGAAPPCVSTRPAASNLSRTAPPWPAAASLCSASSKSTSAAPPKTSARPSRSANVVAFDTTPKLASRARSMRRRSSSTAAAARSRVAFAFARRRRAAARADATVAMSAVAAASLERRWTAGARTSASIRACAATTVALSASRGTPRTA